MTGTREHELPEIEPNFAPRNGAPPSASPKPIRRAWGALTGWAGGAIHRIALPEEDAPDGPLESFVISAPPWLISLVIHIGIMMCLGLIVLEAQPRRDAGIEVDLGGRTSDQDGDNLPLGEQLIDPTQTVSTQGNDDVSQSMEGAAAVTSANPDAAAEPLAGMPALEPTKDGMLPMAAVEGPSIGLALTGREPGMKQALLKAYGGTGKTEGAVSAGLKWLANHQQKNGLWSLSGPYSDGSRGDNDAAATGLALIAFQGAGFTPKGDPKEPFTPVVRRGWNALIKQMDGDGKFFQEIQSNQQLYTQAICTIALCELFGMTDDYQYKEAAQKAVDYCMSIQAPEGGWRYEPMVDSDMSVTGWFVMALQSAKMAGLEVKSPVFGHIEEFLDSVSRENGSHYAYRARDGATLSLSAEGLLCREYLGWKHDDPRLVAGIDYISANPPDWNKRNVYYWYYASQVLHHYEGKPWQDWNEEMRKLLPEKQVKSGKERGSWDPDGDRWGRDGGRLYVTCLSLYIMEVYYRHLPLYQTGLLGK
ncbi:MAG TPA: prenyltransferase/squalene oxidase repeat-containing protein [Lacipirellulaceae bacterium]|jgi:hypothetical protein